MTSCHPRRQRTCFTLHVLPPPAKLEPDKRIALFDPVGETAALLKSLGIAFQPIDAAADLSKFDLLVLGKQALSLDGPLPICPESTPA